MPNSATPGTQAVLVTGGAGYIGSHVSAALAAAGYLPVVYDSLVKGHDWAVQWGPFERGELADRARLDQVLARHRPVAAIHMAAFIEAGESMKDPAPFYRNNVANSLTLLEALKDAGVDRLVFSSTAAVYGTPEIVPIPEDHPKQPINVYGRTKLAIEQMIDDFAMAYGLKAVSLRYFNAAGADPEGRIGELHDPESHAIPLAVLAALGARPGFKIFGTDYATPDGTAIRDYVHVCDLAAAHVAAVGHSAGIEGHDQFNLGSGSGYSVREIVAAVGRAHGSPLVAEEVARRPGDPDRLIADSSRARQVLGWQPQFTEIDAIVETAYRWHSKVLAEGEGRLAAAV